MQGVESGFRPVGRGGQSVGAEADPGQERGERDLMEEVWVGDPARRSDDDLERPLEESEEAGRLGRATRLRGQLRDVARSRSFRLVLGHASRRLYIGWPKNAACGRKMQRVPGNTACARKYSLCPEIQRPGGPGPTGASLQRPRRSRIQVRAGTGSDGRHVGCLLALRALDDLEFDRLPFGQGLESLPLDGGVVHEHILSTRLLDEAKSLRLV